MDSDLELAAAAVVVAVVTKRRRKRKRKPRSVWVKPWLEKRSKLGVYDTLIRELRLEEEEEYTKFLRMNAADFEEVLGLISIFITFPAMFCLF